MPFALTTIGLLLVIVGFQDTYREFGKKIANDFTGEGNFFYWIIAIGAVGALGYNKTLEPFSRAFMALIIVVMFLSNKGFFPQFQSAIQKGTTTPILPAGGGKNIATGGGGNGGGGGNILDSFGLSGGDGGSFLDNIQGAASIADFALSLF